MGWWNNEVRWVNDEDGLRCYFSEPGAGSLSRLGCYRRLLAQSDRLNPRKNRAPSSRGTQTTFLRRLVDLLELARLRCDSQRLQALKEASINLPDSVKGS
jgi:hypothetical protein